jgi:hypothetical protein
MMRLPFRNIWSVGTHFLLVIGQDVMRLPFRKVWHVTHLLLVIDETAFEQHVQFHSHSVGHMKRCDETAFGNIKNIIHLLLVIGQNK